MDLNPAEPKFENIKLLVVEDNPINFMVIEQYLLKLGCIVHHGDTGEKGFELFTLDKFDLVFMDCMLPGMSGLECTQRIRQFEQENHRSPTPIVALTADIRESNRIACMDAGMNEFLGKPFKFNDIVHVLNIWANCDFPE